MNNIKKTGLGLLVATLALGFSAFTTVRRGSILTYYKTSTTYPNANDPRGYAYYEEDRCMDEGSVCSAEWQLGMNPPPTIDGTALPTSGVTFQPGTVITGHFE
ncbi:MAG: hypothetical protein V4594_09045 [Bacteroidota bacterium]